MIAIFNCETLGASEYNLDWLDVVEWQGAMYGLSAQGLERLGGTLETTATPTVLTGQLFPDVGEYNAPKLSFTTSGDASGDIEVQAMMAIVGQEVVGDVITVPLDGTDQYEVLLGSGDIAKTYQIRFGLPDEAKLVAAQIVINPARQRRG